MNAGVLIIDRDTPFRSSLQSHLETEGYRVLKSDRSVEIERWIRRKRLDAVVLVLMDLKREGLHLLSMIKELRPWIQIILINRSEQIALSIEGMNQGAFDDFLMPFNMNDLLTRLEEAVQHKRELHGNRKTWRRKLDDMLIAVSFAEAGELETARQYLNPRDKQAPVAKKTDKPPGEKP